MEQGQQENNQDYFTQTENMNPYYQNASIVSMKIEIDNVLDELELQLRGLAYDKKNKKFIMVVDRPMMNKEGVAHFMSTAKLFFSKVTLLSNLDEEMIKKFCTNFENNITYLIFAKYESYDIDLDYGDTIVDLFGNTYACTLYRALNGFEQKNLSPNIRTVETHSFNPQQNGGRNWMNTLFKK